MIIRLVILVVVAGIAWLFLRWAMPVLEIPPGAQAVVMVLFGLILLVALLGLFGIGPGSKMWGGGPPLSP